MSSSLRCSARTTVSISRRTWKLPITTSLGPRAATRGPRMERLFAGNIIPDRRSLIEGYLGACPAHAMISALGLTEPFILSERVKVQLVGLRRSLGGARPTGLLVYTASEWSSMRDEGTRFVRTVDGEAIWLFEARDSM